MATLEPGRKALRKELDPELLNWFNSYPHDRVAHHMEQVNHLMTRKRKREEGSEDPDPPSLRRRL